MTASKNDKKDMKPALEFIHPDMVLGTGNAMGAGKIKYGDWNLLKGHGKLQLCAAILRHTYAIMKGEDVDKDTTELLGRTVFHYDCICASVNMMIWQRAMGTQKSDRPVAVVHGEVLFDFEIPDEIPDERVGTVGTQSLHPTAKLDIDIDIVADSLNYPISDTTTIKEPYTYTTNDDVDVTYSVKPDIEDVSDSFSYPIYGGKL